MLMGTGVHYPHREPAPLHRMCVCSLTYSFSPSPLSLTAPPEAPQNVSITTSSPTALRVTWAPPPPPSDPITSYNITCTAPGQPSRSVRTSSTASSSSITSLQPYTVYNCCVSAVNLVGRGSGACVSQRTLQDGRCLCVPHRK